MLQRGGAFQDKNSTKFKLPKKRFNIHYNNCTESERPMDQVKFFAGKKKTFWGRFNQTICNITL